MNNKRIWLSLAHMGGQEQRFIQEAFDTNWVVPLGPNVDGFENDLENYLGEEKHIVALSAGTAAIHLALVQLRVGPGDEVICQSFTFSASANPIKYLGAEPVFVDSEPETWNMDPELLREAIEERIRVTGRKPKAIIPVHLYGMPAKMDEIMAVANEFEIPVLEDAAEALGATYKGQKCGTFGAFACLSFNGNKMITTSGGGALVCSTKEEADFTKHLATQARDNAPHYLPTEQHLCRHRPRSDAGTAGARGGSQEDKQEISSTAGWHPWYFIPEQSFTGLQLQYVAHLHCGGCC